MKKTSIRLLLAAMGWFLVSPAQAMNAEEIYKKVNTSVYTIYTVNFYNKKPESLGSAIAVTDHILATNCHVVLTGNYLGVVINNQFKLGTLFFRDVARDICFVEIPGMTFTPVKIRDSKDVKVGEPVYAVGNPEGLEKSISQGIISNKRQDRGGFVLQTDATVSFGSSGGGLFDQQGQLVGITNSVDKYSRNIAFALPSEWISQILFPNNLNSEKVPAKPNVAEAGKVAPKNIKKIANFGKANLGLYSYNNRCFVLLTGKNEYGEASGSAIWYPQKPDVLLVFPGSTDVSQNFQIMQKVFYGSQDSNPSYSGNFIVWEGKKYKLVGIRDDNGRYPLLVSKLPLNTGDSMLQQGEIDVRFADGVTVEGFKKISYSLDGLKETFAAYQKQCIVPATKN